MSTKIIADICGNFCGSRIILEAMIKAAAGVGIDIVKTQSFRADKLRKDWPDYENAYRYYKQHELSESDHLWLMEKCHENGIDFLTTVFDLETVDFLAGLGLKQVKIASPDMMNWMLIDKCLEKFETIIISTGLHTDEETQTLRRYTSSRYGVVLLHCISLYPTPLEAVNLTNMSAWVENWPYHAGFSDHTLTLDASKLAISLGADYIERHFTLSRYLPGKDHFFSSTPEEFAELVAWRDKVAVMMGSGVRELSPEELANREKYRGRWNG